MWNEQCELSICRKFSSNMRETLGTKNSHIRFRTKIFQIEYQNISN